MSSERQKKSSWSDVAFARRDFNFKCWLKVNWNILGPAYNELIDAKKTAPCRKVLLETELFNIAVNDFDANTSTRCRRLLVVTELVVSGTRCILQGNVNPDESLHVTTVIVLILSAIFGDYTATRFLHFLLSKKYCTPWRDIWKSYNLGFLHTQQKRTRKRKFYLMFAAILWSFLLVLWSFSLSSSLSLGVNSPLQGINE